MEVGGGGQGKGDGGGGGGAREGEQKEEEELLKFVVYLIEEVVFGGFQNSYVHL